MTPASATTDAAGRASSSVTLAPTAGPQGFAASTGSISAAINATALSAKPASVLIESGDDQTGTAGEPLRAPFVVLVRDQFGNAVAGAEVSWKLVGGHGSLGAARSITGANGLASVTYTLDRTAGADTIMASVAGVSTSATFTVHTVAATPAAIRIVSGDKQKGFAGRELGDSLVVLVADGNGKPLQGVALTWDPTNGKVAGDRVTREDGTAAAIFTLGSLVGSASVTVSAANTVKVTFAATVSEPAPAPAPAAPPVSTPTPPVPTTPAPTTPAPTTPAPAPTTPAPAPEPKPAMMTIIDGVTGLPIQSTQPIVIDLVAGVAPAQAPFIKVTNGAGEPLADVAIDIAVSGAASTNAKVTTGVNGVASFIGMLTVAGRYAVTVTSAGLQGSPRGATITVSAGAGKRYVVTAGNSMPAAGALVPITAQLVDAFENPVPTPTRVAVNWSLTPAKGGSLSAAQSMTDAEGLATVTYTAPTTTTAFTIVATDASSRTGSTVIKALPISASKLGIVSAIAVLGVTGSRLANFVVQVQDVHGHVVAHSGLTVTARIVSGPPATLGGALAQETNGAGRATFNDLSITGVVGAYVVQFSADGLSPATAVIALTPASWSHTGAGQP